jgi:hypothetical protein
VHVCGFLYQPGSYQAEFRDVFVDLLARELEVMAVAAFTTQHAKQLVEECYVVYWNRELDMAAVARAAIYCG